jgi:hypothetical protein
LFVQLAKSLLDLCCSQAQIGKGLTFFVINRLRLLPGPAITGPMACGAF